MNVFNRNCISRIIRYAEPKFLNIAKKKKASCAANQPKNK